MLNDTSKADSLMQYILKIAAKCKSYRITKFFISSLLSTRKLLKNIIHKVSSSIFNICKEQQFHCFDNSNIYGNLLQLTLKNSNTQFLELFDSSNKFFGPLNITHFFRQKTLDISNISEGRTKLLDPCTISSRSLELSC